MEKKIGDIFEFEGKTFRVKEDKNWTCLGCIFNNRCTLSVKKTAGECEANCREDNKNVLFVEVKEQPQKTEEIKERKIGEIFEYQGKKFKAVEELVQGDCVGCCFFERYDCGVKRRIIGECEPNKRNDNQGIIFVEIIDDLKKQPQEQAKQPLELNLCEMLKYCPKDEPFWSPMFGDVTLYGIDQETKKVLVTAVDNVNCVINADGTVTIYGVTSPEVMLYPSREQRDWSKFTASWLKKEKFNPKTLKAFDKVIVKPDNSNWRCSILSHCEDNNIYYRMIDGYGYSHVIPYNDDTKYLVGTRDKAPDFYRYWED